MQPLHTPTVDGTYRIMPDDIDATRQFLKAFGWAEAEFAALGVVLFCQAKGGWVPFTEDDLTTFFRAAKASGTVFPLTSIWGNAIPEVRVLDKEEGAARLFMSSDRSFRWPPEEPETFRFRHLDPASGLLVRVGADGKFRVTELFIERCHQASPKRNAAPAP